MSKQKLKKVKMKLSDIHICETGPHYAEWRVNGVWQKWIGKRELEKIYLMYKVRPLRMMLKRPIK